MTDLIELDDNVRRALGLAVQILQDMPEWLQPGSNMDDMRDLLAGQSSGRDGLIIAEALAITLCWRTIELVEAPPTGAAQGEVHARRIKELMDLFELLQRAIPPPSASVTRRCATG